MTSFLSVIADVSLKEKGQRTAVAEVVRLEA